MSASASSSSAASIAAAIYESEDERREQVSDVVHDRTNDEYDGMNDNDTSNNKDEETDEDMIFKAAWEIMNRLNKKTGSATMEECQFCSWHMEWDHAQSVEHAGGGWPAPQE